MQGSADTIFALSSAPGRAGVAVIRISGSLAAHCLETFTGSLPDPRTAVLRAIADPQSGEIIDRGLVLWFPAPQSFTGEDSAELQVHGGRAVIAAVLDALAGMPGCRIAEPGEFARRAFENNKLDLTAVEGLADLIDAQTQAQRRQALRQADGALARLYEEWRGRLIEALALQEAVIDFSDEADVTEPATQAVRGTVEGLIKDLSRHLSDRHRGEILRDGFHVVLAGPPNVGKSSLLNALARRDVAIVSKQAGTTRDVIEVRLELDGLPIVISDTAGIRPEADAAGVGEVEREGINRTFKRARSADLVVWLRDGATGGGDGQDAGPPSAILEPDVAVLQVANKCDLDPSGVFSTGAGQSDCTEMRISARTGAGIGVFTARLTEIVADRIGIHTDPALTQQRHRELLGRCLADLEAYLKGSPDDTELRAEDLRRAATALGRITGRVDVEDVLDKIFSSFCIGK